MAPPHLAYRALCSLCLLSLPGAMSPLTITANSTFAHQMIELSCVSSVHVLSYQWMKGNISAVTIYRLSKDNASLYIPDAVFEDCGLYICIAETNGAILRAEYKLIIDGILPYEYRIITTAIAGLGCMLTSVSAFMLSTLFRDQKTRKFLVGLCLLCLMSSLLLLVAATTLWIFIDGWSIESVALLAVSVVFMLTPMIMFVGKRIGSCKRFWANNWLPILVAMFVHITIITTVILIMKKYEYSEEGCASEWPLIHKLFGAVASPFVLCLLVYFYTKPNLLTEQKAARQQAEIATASTTAADIPITTARNVVSTSSTIASIRSITSNSVTNARLINITHSSPVTSLYHHINIKPCTDTVPSKITPAVSPATSVTAPIKPNNIATNTTLATPAIHAPSLVTPIKITPTTLATTRPTNTLTVAVTPTVTTPITFKHPAGTYPVTITYDEPVQPSEPTPVDVAQQEEEAFTGTSGWPRRRGCVPAGGVNAASHDLLALMFHDEFSRVQQAETTGVGGPFTGIQSAMADMQTSFHTDLHNVHRSMQSDIVDLQSKIQSGFTGLQCVLQSGIAEHLTAVRTGLGNLQDVLCRGLSDIRDTVHTGLIQGDSSIQKVHATVLEGLAQISEEADSVVSLLTEVVDNQSSAQSSRTDVFDTPGGLREQEENTVTNGNESSNGTGFSKCRQGRVTRTSCSKSTTLDKEPLVPTRKSPRKKKWKGRKCK
ncbi:uncharacterized protein [Scyliorhinus torazame]|uniref:uncharacterized protein n=1 Tax=Scyliorhinus torazame TaxID=75743 RepID=UPI003B5BA635